MQSNYGSAITHVQSGMKILSEVRYNQKTRRYQHDVLVLPEIPFASIEMLQDIFVNLDLQAIHVSPPDCWNSLVSDRNR
jgi:hypothetical protein